MDLLAALLPWAFLFVLGNAALPAQLIMTGYPETIEELPEDVKANIMKIRALSPGLKFRWFGDYACHQYIKDHYDDELVEMYDEMLLGMYRGDICRSAILYKEGGFYVDVDVEMAVPLTSIVDKNTTFASVFSMNGDIFNAILAAEPQNEILAKNMEELRQWGRRRNTMAVSTNQGLMGTQCLYRALQSVVNKSCGASLEAKKRTTQWTCGRHNLKMYREDRLLCSAAKRGLIVNDVVQKDLIECGSAVRQNNTSEWAQIGLFPAGQPIYPNRSLIGWSRFGGCDKMGCNSAGHVVSDVSLTELRWKKTSPGVWGKVRVRKMANVPKSQVGTKVEQTTQSTHQLPAIQDATKAYARRAKKLVDLSEGKLHAQMEATSRELSKDKLSELLDARGEGKLDEQMGATLHGLPNDKGLMRRAEASSKKLRSSQQG